MKTPQLSYPTLAQKIGIPEVYFKHEERHHFGSHKGRSLPYMIEHYVKKQGVQNFVISSSGNAALAAILMVQQHNTNKPKEPPLTLRVFVGQRIDSTKFDLLKKTAVDPHITIEQVPNPRQTAFKINAAGEAKSLRQSTDDVALTGYVELAKELSHIPDLGAIFIPTSSGTTAEALGKTFIECNHIPQLHIVQTTACHPMAGSFMKDDIRTESSIAGAIVDTIAERKQNVLALLKTTQGSGWVVTDEEIQEAMKLVQDTIDMRLSPNSALAVAGLIKAKQQGWTWNKPVVCLITGA